ncbi:MAG: TonB family protein [Pseudoxanthomonas sp.]
MKKALIVALVIALCPCIANATKPSEMRKQIESSMLVRGAIETNADGSVGELTIDSPEKLPAGLVDFVQKQVSAWKFEPVLVDGKPVRARSRMSVRVVARMIDKDSYSIGIRNANFDGEPPKEGEALSSTKLTPPRYPQNVARAGASGTVYVVIKVGKDGRLIDAMVEQVNLKTIGTGAEMSSWRNALADAALKAARDWTYAPPVKGELADDEFWSARVPVDFKMGDRIQTGYGKWEVYIPGPRQTIPWSKEERPGFSPDSLADGGVYMLGMDTGPKLLTPLDGT